MMALVGPFPTACLPASHAVLDCSCISSFGGTIHASLHYSPPWGPYPFAIRIRSQMCFLGRLLPRNCNKQAVSYGLHIQQSVLVVIAWKRGAIKEGIYRHVQCHTRMIVRCSHHMSDCWYNGGKSTPSHITANTMRGVSQLQVKYREGRVQRQLSVLVWSIERNLGQHNGHFIGREKFWYAALLLIQLQMLLLRIQWVFAIVLCQWSNFPALLMPPSDGS